jgi:hypothetical protein
MRVGSAQPTGWPHRRQRLYPAHISPRTGPRTHRASNATGGTGHERIMPISRFLELAKELELRRKTSHCPPARPAAPGSSSPSPRVDRVRQRESSRSSVTCLGVGTGRLLIGWLPLVDSRHHLLRIRCPLDVHTPARAELGTAANNDHRGCFANPAGSFPIAGSSPHLCRRNHANVFRTEFGHLLVDGDP